jgi:hypothetical protein
MSLPENVTREFGHGNSMVLSRLGQSGDRDVCKDVAEDRCV